MSDEPQIEMLPGDQAPPPRGLPPTVQIKREAVRVMREHARQDLGNELAGLLLGGVWPGEGASLVQVEVALPAEHVASRRGSVTFTHETWQYLFTLKDRDYPDLRIVGWYHTHPGFGIFLSEYDTFIHRNFFAAPWQVAYVTDPLAQQSGCFVWQGSELARADDYDLYGSAVEESFPPAPPTELPAEFPDLAAALRPRHMPTWAAMLLGLFALVLGMQLAVMWALSARRHAPAPPPPASVRATPVPPPVTPGPPRAPVPSAPPPRVLPPPPATYVVQQGDSLWRIAAQHYGGRGELWPFLARANGLRGPEDLEPRMRLVIPPLEQIYQTTAGASPRKGADERARD